jgi:hypothetical protein
LRIAWFVPLNFRCKARSNRYASRIIRRAIDRFPVESRSIEISISLFTLMPLLGPSKRLY